MKFVNIFTKLIKNVRSVNEWEEAVRETIKARKGKKVRGRYEAGKVADERIGLLVEPMISKLHEAQKNDASGIEREQSRSAQMQSRGLMEYEPQRRRPNVDPSRSSLHDLIQAVRTDQK